jgi:hypothetical protein
MDDRVFAAELARYQTDLGGILSRFSHTSSGIHINRADDPTLRQYVHELIDLFADVSGINNRVQRPDRAGIQ